jgi:hypothetical protein
MIVNNVVASEHSDWVLDSLVSDEHANILPTLYAPILQTAMSAAYKLAPTLVEKISHCYDRYNSGGNAGMCVLAASASWLQAGLAVTGSATRQQLL